MDTSKEGIKAILVERDGISEDAAQDIIDETQRMVDQAIAEGYVWDVEQIIADQLGLEPDYIFDFLDI